MLYEPTLVEKYAPEIVVGTLTNPEKNFTTI